MKKTGRETTTTQKGDNAFAGLLRNYETQARQRTPQTETEYTTALENLATACAYSVLKKLCNVGGTVTENSKNTTDTAKTIRTLRQSIARDTNNIKRIKYATNNATALERNADGYLVTVTKDKGLKDAVASLCAETLGDGIDLMHTAIVTILNETAKASDLNTDFMETPYAVRRLKRKVYIREADSVGGYETVTTTPIQEVFKAIRRDIESNRSIQVASRKYTYLADIATDTETDTQDAIYRRLPKYSGLAYEVTDINGKITAITADNQTVDDTERLIEKLNLTAKQAKILQLRISGHGYKSIATYLGVHPNTIKTTMRRLQEKAVAIGLTPIK